MVGVISRLPNLHICSGAHRFQEVKGSESSVRIFINAIGGFILKIATVSYQGAMMSEDSAGDRAIIAGVYGKSDGANSV